MLVAWIKMVATVEVERRVRYWVCFRGRASLCVGPGGSGWVCRGQGSRVGEGQGGCEVEGVGRGPAGPGGGFGT